MPTLLMIAWRNLVRNRRRTLFVIAALTVGLTAITIMRSYLNAVHSAQLDNQLLGRYGHLEVHRQGFMANVLANPLDFSFEDSSELRAKIKAVPGVMELAPRIAFSAMYSGPELPGVTQRTGFFSLLAIDPKLEAIVSPKLSENIALGRQLAESRALELVLNVELSRSLQARVDGDGGVATPESEWPILLANDAQGSMNGVAVHAVGTVIATLPGDNRFGFVGLKVAQDLLRLPQKVTEYALRINDPSEVTLVQERLAKSLGPTFEVHRWDEVVPMLKQLLSTTTLLFGVVTGIFLGVIFLGLVNVMLMSVLERVREIGTMMSVGTRRKTILWLFLIEGASIGAMGGVIGLSLGSAVVYYLNLRGVHLAPPGNESELLLRPFVTLKFVAAMETFAIGGAVLASVWPAFKASRLNPTEALSRI